MAQQLFNDFVAQYFRGSQSAAAHALGIDKSMVCRVIHGGRGVSPQLALKIEQISEGRFPKEQFIWPSSEAA